MSLNVAFVFLLLGPVFLLLGVGVAARARRVTPQARTWLLLGGIFSVVAFWLNTRPV